MAAGGLVTLAFVGVVTNKFGGWAIHMYIPGIPKTQDVGDNTNIGGEVASSLLHFFIARNSLSRCISGKQSLRNASIVYSPFISCSFPLMAAGGLVPFVLAKGTKTALSREASLPHMAFALQIGQNPGLQSFCRATLSLQYLVCKNLLCPFPPHRPAVLPDFARSLSAEKKKEKFLSQLILPGPVRFLPWGREGRGFYARQLFFQSRLRSTSPLLVLSLTLATKLGFSCAAPLGTKVDTGPRLMPYRHMNVWPGRRSTTAGTPKSSRDAKYYASTKPHNQSSIIQPSNFPISHNHRLI